MTRMPVLTDFNCAHPGCGARKGYRCTYTGWRHGHPIRQQRLLEALDRRISQATTPAHRARLVAHRAAQAASFRPGHSPSQCTNCADRERLHSGPSNLDKLRYPPDGNRARWVLEGDTSEAAA